MSFPCGWSRCVYYWLYSTQWSKARSNVWIYIKIKLPPLSVCADAWGSIWYTLQCTYRYGNMVIYLGWFIKGHEQWYFVHRIVLVQSNTMLFVFTYMLSWSFVIIKTCILHAYCWLTLTEQRYIRAVVVPVIEPSVSTRVHTNHTTAEMRHTTEWSRALYGSQCVPPTMVIVITSNKQPYMINMIVLGQGCCNISYPSQSQSSISLAASFCNFAHSTAVSLPCSVQNFKTI